MADAARFPRKADEGYLAGYRADRAFLCAHSRAAARARGLITPLRRLHPLAYW